MDLKTANYTNDIGDAELAAVVDLRFSAEQPADLGCRAADEFGSSCILR